MITDIFSRRYPNLDLQNLSNAFFVQLFNIYNDPHTGIKKTLLEKIQDYPYSTYADEHIRIIAQAQDKLCNELGHEDLDQPEYQSKDLGYNDYRILKKYVFDEGISAIEKLSLFEILFRDTETHLLNEVQFIEANVPKYEARSTEIKALSAEKKVKYHNDGEEKLSQCLPLLDKKKSALSIIQTEINQRLKLHNMPLAYHNGFFQLSADPVIEAHVASPFWALLSNSKYKNVETDILQAIDLYDTGGRDPAFYAAKALESMIKIICNEKNLITGKEKGAADFISHLNSKNNGQIIINHERDELLAMFRIRNTHGGHGLGNAEMPVLTDAQSLKYIHSVMIWVYSLSKR